jgi:DNA polymerase-3 subunit beta
VSSILLSGYNLETGITVGVPADVQEPGTCVMPARLFFDIIRKLPDDTVSISVTRSSAVSIRGGISSFTITAMSADDYPELPDVDSEKGIQLPQRTLRDMISGTIFSVSENQARPIHTGCLFEVDNNSVTIVAVDGYRLALRRCTPEKPLDRSLRFVVPAAALKEVEKISATPTIPRPSSSAASTSSSRSATPRSSAASSRASSSTGGACCPRTAP